VGDRARENPMFDTLHSATFSLMAMLLLGSAGCRDQRMINDQAERELTRERLAQSLGDGVIDDEVVVEFGRLTDDDLAILADHPRIKRVEIRSNPVGFGDPALKHLAKLPNLEWINLPASQVTDDGISQLSKLEKLRILNLHQTKITDNGLKEIASLPNLELLRFGSPHVSDAGIDQIANVKSLRFLHLIDVPITDAGLKSIESMPNLESFYLDGGRTTDEGLSALIKARPQLHFHQDQQHLADDPRRDDHSHGHDHSHAEGHGHSHDE
jgi:hypothetical protein